MKGLLLKDFYNMKKCCWTFLIIILVFTIVSVFGDNNSFFIAYPVIIAGMIPVTLISYDERSRWDVYCDTLPYSRAQVVASKYIFTILLVAASVVFVGLAQIAKMFRADLFVWDGYFSLLGCLMVLGAISPGIILPFIFKFGAEKGRYAYFVMIFVACIGSGILGDVLKYISESEIMTWLPAICILGSILLFTISWKVSVVFYQKREF